MDFCNSRHPEIQRLVEQLSAKSRAQRGGGRDESEAGVCDDSSFVKAAFDFVRDEIAYEWMLDWTVPAEYTLTTRRGNCLNKACLLVTLLRARGLEAAFLVGRIPIDSNLIRRMAPDWVWPQFPCSTSPHAVVTVCLILNNNDDRLDDRPATGTNAKKDKKKWIVLDPTVDSVLARGMSHFGNPEACFAWDGVQHAVNPFFLKVQPKQFDTIDFVLHKKPSYGPGLVALMEASAFFLRTFGPLFKAPETLQRALEHHLLTTPCAGRIVSSAAAAMMSYQPPQQQRREHGSDVTANYYCDPQHPQIRELAQKLRTKKGGGARSDVDFCKAAFTWVRDNILYTLQADWRVPVQQTLAIGQGMCSTKACLLTSFLRAGGLKAGFYVKSQDAATDFLAPPWIVQHYRRASVHFLSAVNLHGQWIKLDPWMDRYLATSMEAANLVYDPTVPSLVTEFDGQHHALNYADCDSMRFLSDADMDRFMDKKSRVPTAVIQCHNLCLELLRRLGPVFSSREDALAAMDNYLLGFHPELVAQVATISRVVPPSRSGKSSNTTARSKL